MTTLFKYHKDDKNLKKILIDKTLYCCDRLLLNDPFDGLYLISEELKDKLAVKFIPTVRKTLPDIEIYKSLPDELIFHSARNSINDISFYDILHNSEHRLSLNICSLTEDPKNELMWAHYAGNSTGVCLEFNFELDDIIKTSLTKVIYTNDTPKIADLTESEIRKALSIKRKAWEYEQEWRLLFPSDLIKFNPQSLKTIYFGPRTPDETISNVYQICQNSELTHVTYKRLNVDLDGMIFQQPAANTGLTPFEHYRYAKEKHK